MYKRIQFSKTYLLSFLVGCLFCAQPIAAQSDSLLQQLITANNVDSSLIQPPVKLHENMGMAVNLSYGFTALNGLFAPPSAFSRDKKITSIRLHKWLAVLHLSGMIATNILGTQIEDNVSLKPYHRAAAYVSFASLATALVVIKF